MQEEQTPGFDMKHMFVWIKGLEIKVNSLLREIDIIKNDFIKRNSDMKKEIKILSDDVLEIKHNHSNLVSKIDLIVKELKRTAGVEELMTIKKYIDLWNPINFVTQRDVERIIELKLKNKDKGDK